MSAQNLAKQACLVGGGPAGMMLGLLLARAKIDVLVIEKHGDFLRDFRGDTIHPSTLEMIYELGLLDELLKLPHQKAPRIQAWFGDAALGIDFTRVPAHCQFLMFMPQWEFLNFLAKKAAAYPSFHLRMDTEATDLIWEGDRAVGVRAKNSQGDFDIRAGLVVATDGRHSLLRQKAGLQIQEFGAPMDVLWFRLPRHSADPELPMARFSKGGAFIMLNQGTHWQCGYVIAKGGFDQLQALGLPAFKKNISQLAPLTQDRLAQLRDWEPVKLLTVKIDRLKRWHRQGLLCIGDAAHAMSPVGGVGINLAIQDAVATANLLAQPLRAGNLDEADLEKVQRRRLWPTQVTQRLQMLIQNQIISRVLEADPGDSQDFSPPALLRLMSRFPALQRIPGRLVGIGVRPEHIDAAPMA